ncbi:aminotransferase class V-fold PLP-dependent enzyme [Streptomyces lydicus]|uniref:aminotransferase class V-fold PLP-dependent enzyme n=1 Tax=Streptomyces lydicus TaxID=47763 RepID=UPI0036EA73B1
MREAETTHISGSALIAKLRATEFGYLDDSSHVYLDHTGGGLPARSRLAAHFRRLTTFCYGNPHSENPTSSASSELIDSARCSVLRYLNADPDEYVAIFTPNATGACRLVGEAYPFAWGDRLVLTLDNHNSVNGLREYAHSRGAHMVSVPFTGHELRISDADVEAALSGGGDARKLFAYPAQSNFSGVQHSLDWVEMAHAHGCDVLLDAAAYLPTNRLDLSRVHPDFVAVSWYKVFGYPTGLGCLVARREAIGQLRRPWFSGGTVQAASAQIAWHRMADDASAFEDGTLNYLSIPDVETGLDWIRSIGIDTIHEHVAVLTECLLNGLRALQHSNGAPMVRIFGPHDGCRRGATVALHLLGPDGLAIDERVVSRDSAASNISLRAGCFCNPGAGEAAFGIPRTVLDRASRLSPDTIDEYVHSLGLPHGGAVRVSLGVSSNYSDVLAFLEFIVEIYRDRPHSGESLGPRVHC